MIRVTIELLPFGRTDIAKTLSVLSIFNTGRVLYDTTDNPKYIYKYEADIYEGNGTIRKCNGIVKHRRRDVVFTMLDIVLYNIIAYLRKDGYEIEEL